MSPLGIIPFVFAGTFLNDFIWSMGISVYFFNYSLSIIGLLYLLNLAKFSEIKFKITENEKFSIPGIILIILTLSIVAAPLTGGFTGFILIFSKLSVFSPYLGLFGLIFLSVVIYGFIKKYNATEYIDVSDEILQVHGIDYLLFSIILILILGLGIFPKFLFNNFLKIPM